MTSKYDPLQQHLKAQSSAHILMSFAEIEQLLGFDLPPSARKHRPWWSNNPSNSRITEAWLSAGYQSAKVDMAAGCLVFRRQQQNPSPFSAGWNDASGAEKSKSFYGCMQGMITILDNHDLTAPADPDWRQQTEGI
ncbi:DUF7662 domain-containing protein [Candidatus Spongiihabitans sp.]|uniref:DUF7662 domain-containing protein n=1 Tax=Candidatus Spongiihabitans sp. TaxID=3101308 RepID=UPI003C7C30E9